MKKYLLLIPLFFLGTHTALGFVDFTGKTTVIRYFGIPDEPYNGQSVSGADMSNIIKADLRSYGSNSDSILLTIQTDDDGKPSGTVLASDEIAGNLLTTSCQTYEFDIDDPISFSSANEYWLVFSRVGSLDVDNHYANCGDGSNFYSGGVESFYDTTRETPIWDYDGLDLGFGTFDDGFSGGGESATSTYDTSFSTRFYHPVELLSNNIQHEFDLSTTYIWFWLYVLGMCTFPALLFLVLKIMMSPFTKIFKRKNR